MPVFALDDDLVFPPVSLAEPDGLLAIGGDLSVRRLINAYQQGIFPWNNPDEPILWWSPDPRFVLYPAEIKVSKSMKQVLRRGQFELSFDQDFRAVITQCQLTPRERQIGTWITSDMLEAYCKLHKLGYAHSVEVWEASKLVGGLYGVSLGNCFFGESMFAHVSNASKFGFIRLVQELTARNFSLIDCQVPTSHLASLGARAIPRPDFMRELGQGLQHETHKYNWGKWLSPTKL